jgi:6-phosphofructokinase 2
VLRDLLTGEGVAQRPIEIEAWTRENLTVFEKSSEQQFRFGMPGPELDEEDWQRCLAELRDLDADVEYLVASGSLPGGTPVDFYGRVGAIAKQRNWRYVLDASGDSLRRGVEEGVFLLKPNLRELGQLAGKEIENEAQQERVAKDLIDEGRCEVVVVSLGAAGVLLVTREGSERMVPPTVPIRSKVGAGDSMVAGILVGLSRDMGLRESVRYGIAAGAAAVMTPGSELCRAEDTERLIRSMRQQN